MKNNDKSKIVEIKTVADYINFQVKFHSIRVH